MIDHIGFAVSDLERSKAFYAAVLGKIGLELVVALTAEQTGGGAHAGFGSGGKAFFWIGDQGTPPGRIHVAFPAQSRAAVDAFHAAAMAAGAMDNGAPGLRPWFHPDYYAAFVLDPDGVNIEAVCREGE